MRWLIWLLIWLIMGAEGNYHLSDDNYDSIYGYDSNYYSDGDSTYIDMKIDENEKPAILNVIFEADKGDYYVNNTYNSDVLVSGTVGMVSVPVEIEKCDGAISEDDNARLTFIYDESKLTCTEEELVIMRYVDQMYGYDIITDFNLDKKNNTISVSITEEGTYLLEDSVIWSGVWNGTYVQPDTMKERDCHWHEVFDYEDIEELADTTIYDESGEYHIYTVNQLAGLVKLVNEGRAFNGSSFYLESDLDLAGYDWVPIGWYYPANDGYKYKDFPFNGKFYGNGHVIYNMTMLYPEWNNIGLFGRALSEFSVHDLGLVNCNVEGQFYVGGIVGDNINPGEDFDMIGCFVTGDIKGYDKVGALVGSSAYLKLKDCYAWVKLQGDEDGEQLVGDLRMGEIVNCYLNDDESKKMLAEYIQ